MELQAIREKLRLLEASTSENNGPPSLPWSSPNPQALENLRDRSRPFQLQEKRGEQLKKSHPGQGVPLKSRGETVLQHSSEVEAPSYLSTAEMLRQRMSPCKLEKSEREQLLAANSARLLRQVPMREQGSWLERVKQRIHDSVFAVIASQDLPDRSSRRLSYRSGPQSQIYVHRSAHCERRKRQRGDSNQLIRSLFKTLITLPSVVILLLFLLSYIQSNSSFFNEGSKVTQIDSTSSKNQSQSQSVIPKRYVYISPEVSKLAGQLNPGLTLRKVVEDTQSSDSLQGGTDISAVEIASTQEESRKNTKEYEYVEITPEKQANDVLLYLHDSRQIDNLSVRSNSTRASHYTDFSSRKNELDRIVDEAREHHLHISADDVEVAKRQIDSERAEAARIKLSERRGLIEITEDWIVSLERDTYTFQAVYREEIINSPVMKFTLSKNELEEGSKNIISSIVNNSEIGSGSIRLTLFGTVEDFYEEEDAFIITPLATHFPVITP